MRRRASRSCITAAGFCLKEKFHTEIAKITKTEHKYVALEPVLHSGRWVLPEGEITHKGHRNGS
jgi:hypothetical protein